MKVLKFGGTSVGSAQRIKNVASIVCDQEQKIVVLSAMAGTTNSLVEISECFHKKDPEKANAVLSSLEQAYVNHIEELYRSDVYKEKPCNTCSNGFNMSGLSQICLSAYSMKRKSWCRVS